MSLWSILACSAFVCRQIISAGLVFSQSKNLFLLLPLFFLYSVYIITYNTHEYGKNKLRNVFNLNLYSANFVFYIL